MFSSNQGGEWPPKDEEVKEINNEDTPPISDEEFIAKVTQGNVDFAESEANRDTEISRLPEENSTPDQPKNEEAISGPEKYLEEIARSIMAAAELYPDDMENCFRIINDAFERIQMKNPAVIKEISSSIIKRLPYEKYRVIFNKFLEVKNNI